MRLDEMSVPGGFQLKTAWVGMLPSSSASLKAFMAQCSKPIMDDNCVSVSRMRLSIEVSADKVRRIGTRALIGPIMYLIPATGLLRADVSVRKEISFFISGRSSLIESFAIVRAQAASTRASKSASCPQGARMSHETESDVDTAFSIQKSAQT